MSKQSTASAFSDSSASEPLNEREHEILLLIAAGFSNQEIAEKLFLAQTTVKWYIRQLYSKIGVGSRTQAIIYAREHYPGVEPITQPTALPSSENPYKGLQAFQSADSDHFYGRETFTQTLVQRLAETGEYSRFLAILGPSGSGKSSLVKAGLIPALQRGELPGSQNWLIIEMLPGSRPLDELEIALSRIAASYAPVLNDHLRRDNFGLVRIAQLILPDNASQLVIVIDQFEEVFTLVEDEAARRHFLALLVAAVTEPRSRVHIILTLRADFYDRPLHYRQFGELVRRRMETLLPLAPDELERAIIKPAERAGVAFEDGLVASIITDVNHQAGALPLLQYALTLLFEQRQGHLTQTAYRQIGGVGGALAKHADAIYVALDPTAQEITRQMFLRLVTLGEGTEDTRRRTLYSELMGMTSDPDILQDILDTYAANRLLTLDYDMTSRAPTVEVAHEAILREWQRLREWLNETRDEIRLQRQLAHVTEEWHTAKQDASFLLRGSRLDIFEKWVSETQLALTQAEREFLAASLQAREHEHQIEQKRQAREYGLERRSRNFLRGLAAILLLATIGAFILTRVAITERDRARRNEAEANNQRNIAQRNETEARQQRDLAQQRELEARSLALAFAAQLALNEGNIEEAIRLINEARLLDPDNPHIRHVLDPATYAPSPLPIFQDFPGFVPTVLDPHDLRFILISHGGPGDSFWDVAFRGMHDACTFLQVSCLWLGRGNGNWDRMARSWEQALEMNPDGIGTTNIDDEIIGDGLAQASESGIPVVVFNVARSSQQNDPRFQRYLYIGSDDYIAGQASARRIFAQARADGVTINRGVCFNPQLDQAFFRARCAGFASIFHDVGVPVDQTPVHSYFIRDVALDQLTEYIANHPTTNALFAPDQATVSILNDYIQQAGLKPGEPADTRRIKLGPITVSFARTNQQRSKLYVTSLDISPDIFQMIHDGYLLQTVDQQQYIQGFQTVISLYLYRQYGLRPSGFINTSSIVDQSNVESVSRLVNLGYR